MDIIFREIQRTHRTPSTPESHSSREGDEQHSNEDATRTEERKGTGVRISRQIPGNTTICEAKRRAVFLNASADFVQKHANSYTTNELKAMAQNDVNSVVRIT
jgi:hypothetical protein